MKTTLLFWLFGLMCFFTHSQSLMELDTTEYFDFWVGEWQVAWDEGNGVEVLGTNTIAKSLDDKVIIENFRITRGKSAGFKGMSMSVYQKRFKRWKQVWSDNQGGYFDFTGAVDGDKRMFATAVTEKNGKQQQQRMVFYDIEENSMTWDWEKTEDGGKTWSLLWRIFYTRND
ncbi:hypothetical protein [Marinoscillum sp. MHG1-6]|uniref:hypothetical protein n=1 Tax=Marinoscillum sp. MHG1-6 TaxID=2959627 RepID=UPI00215891FF|nr:hypothetical protein [Marinoscillum sp. MHG1-6]